MTDRFEFDLTEFLLDLRHYVAQIMTCEESNNTNTSACAAVEAELLVWQEQQFATISLAITQFMAS